MTVPPPEVLNVAFEGTVSVFAMLKFDELVTVAAEAKVRLKKVGAEPEVTIDAPLFRVIVPAVGANAAEVVSAFPTVAVVDAVIAALIVKFSYVVLVMVALALE